MTDARCARCAECGMSCNADEYHPYAACLMFKQCHNSETVRTNLEAVRSDTYHQGRVAGELFGLRQGLLIAYIFEFGTAKQVIEGIKSRIAEIEQQAQGGKP